MSVFRRAWVPVLLLCAVAAAADAQANARNCDRNAGVGGNRVQGVYPNAPYDGKFIFARIAYATGFGRGEPPWHHDYNEAETHFTKLLINLTKIKAHTTKSNVLTLDDPELMKFPIAYMSEPGFWYPGEPEVIGLRNYLKKGGFLIFDDFFGEQIYRLIQGMERVLPGMKLVEIPTDHPIFDSFYRVRSFEFYHSYQCIKSEFYGIFEDNDPKKRMLAIVNQNSDFGEVWEWSDRGIFAIEISNEAYKLGINYMIYAMTR
jgi:hypothetical protein